MATSAVQEGVLEEMMEKVSAMWAKTEFEVRTYDAGRLKDTIGVSLYRPIFSDCRTKGVSD